EETLKVFNQWLCGKCMDLHAVSRACHRLDGLVCFSKGSDDMSGYIVGISKPSNKESGTELTEGLVLDAELLDGVFKVRLSLFPRCTLKVYGPKNRQERSILDGFALGSFDQGGGDFLKDGATSNTIIKQCLRKVADGHFTATVKVLSSSDVASYCDDTIKALEAKHPYKSPPSMPSITFSEPPLIAEIDSVFSCIKSFPKGTSCERDGLRAQHILDALCGEGSATITNLLKVITSVVDLWLAWRYLPILAEFVAFAPLTPLLKPDSGIRPIAVGTIWRRLVSKVAMKGVGKEMSKYLSDFQFRVGVSGGAEAILHSVNRVLCEYHNDGSLAMLTVHFSNAFNLVDRSELLHEQGDPLGPLLFALILHPLLHKIKDSCKLLLHAWYFDDGTVIGDLEEVTKVLDIIKLREGLFPVDIRRPSSGVKLLGGAVSRDADLISGLAMRRAANPVDLMGLLPQLHDPHSELLLLRSYHILRDSGICGMDDDYVYALACLRDTFSSSDFSGFTNKDTVPSKAQQTLANVLFSEMVKDMEVHFDMTMRQITVFECLRAPHAQDFRAIPIDGLGQHISPVEYHTILKYRLMIPLFLVDAICLVCRKACLDSFGEHADLVEKENNSIMKTSEELVVPTCFFFLINSARRLRVFRLRDINLFILSLAISFTLPLALSDFLLNFWILPPLIIITCGVSAFLEELNLTDGADREVIVEDKGSCEKSDSTADQVSTARPEVSIASVSVNVSAATPSTPHTTTTIFGDEDLTIAQTLIKLRSEKAKVKGVAFRDVEEPLRLTRLTTTLPHLPTIDPKDKGKSVLVEEEPENLEKVKKKDQGLAQIKSDAYLAQRIYEEEFAKFDIAQMEKQKQEEATIAALTEEFDEIQARIDADHELAIRMTHEKQEKYTIEESARLLAEYFKRRMKQLAAERAATIRNKPPTRTQVRNMMITYLKHMEENKSMEPESEGKKGKRIKRVTDSALKQKSSKKQKMMQEQEYAKSDEEAAANYEHEKKELRMWLTIVPDEKETVDPEILSTKYPIVNLESQNLGNVNMEDLHVYKIIKANRNTSYYKSPSMMRKFNRQDLVDLHRLVMKRFKGNTLKGYNLLLWGDLKVMFEPNAEDEIWSNQQDWNLIKKRYPLIKEMLENMLNWKLEVEAESTMTFELLKSQMNIKFRGGWLGIEDFFNLILLMMVSVADEDM
nr:putative reverse transcriptase domain-containing protein [Tanacetum cinerariifolium]